MPTTDTLGLADEPDVEPASTVYGLMAVCTVLLGLSALLFYFVPGLDLTVSGWFYQPGRGFVGNSGPVVAVRNFGIAVTIATAVAVLIFALWWHFAPDDHPHWSAEPRWADWIFITAGMAVGPGILVNLIVKPLFGRARPRHIEQFGGTAHFSPAWVISDQCKWGCSFVSGEAAATCLVLAFCFVVPRRWQMSMLIAGCLMTLAISLARIAAGGHFLSDVVTAWLLTLLVILVLRAQIYHGVLLGPFKRFHPGL